MTRIEIDNSSVDLLLYELAQEFLDEHRTKGVSLVEFAARYPDLADEIHDTFPGLLFAEDLRSISEVPEQAPDTIGGYRLVRKIGTGGMGTVYEAEHPKLTRKTAIKLLHNSAKESVRKRFLHEAELASRLNHSNIVPLIDFSEDAGTPYISMLYVDGISFDRILRNFHEGENSQTQPRLVPGKDFQRIASFGAQTAAALAHAHESGMIHRDIKPGNLIFDQNGKTWVTDFGLATEFQNELESQEFAGTPRYMAPEQFKGKADERTDVYSLGLTLYEFASGVSVFRDCSHRDIINQKSRPLPDIRTVNSAVPQALADIIMRACEVQSTDRYPSAKELQVVLNRFAHSGILGDRRSKSRDASDRSKKSMRPAFMLGVCAALCAVAILRTLMNDVPPKTHGYVRWYVFSQPASVSSDTGQKPDDQFAESER